MAWPKILRQKSQRRHFFSESLPCNNNITSYGKIFYNGIWETKNGMEVTWGSLILGVSGVKWGFGGSSSFGGSRIPEPFKFGNCCIGLGFLIFGFLKLYFGVYFWTGLLGRESYKF